MCAMATAPRNPSPQVDPSLEMHTPPDHRVQVLDRMLAHAAELRAPSAEALPLANLPVRPHSEPKGRAPAGAAHIRARTVHSNIINDAHPQLPQELRAGQNIAAVAILLQALLEPEDPAQRDIHHQVRHLVELAAV